MSTIDDDKNYVGDGDYVLMMIMTKITMMLMKTMSMIMLIMTMTSDELMITIIKGQNLYHKDNINRL